MSVDGFMSWAVSSQPAFKQGYFFATRKKTIALPSGSLANDAAILAERIGKAVPARLWFPQFSEDATAIEMKIHSDNYDQTLTLLLLPSGTPRFSTDEEGQTDAYDRFSQDRA